MKSIIVLFALISYIYGCTNIMVTKGASVDGSQMVTYSADYFPGFGYLEHFKEADHPPGSWIDIHEWDTGKYLGKIPQVEHTWNVIGNMNQHQLAIGETTYGGREELHDPNGILDYGSLIYITLQRAKNAREAMKIMTELVANYGYYSSGESFSIVDKNEVWMMELIGKGPNRKGAVWVAMQIPDGYIASHANQARITRFQYQKNNDWFNPAQKVFNSPDVISFARDMGYFNGRDEIFSFSDTYNPLDFQGARYSELRVWSTYSKLDQSIKPYFGYASGNNITFDPSTGYATNRMPLYIRPSKKLSAIDVMNLMRDHYEATPLSPNKDIGGEPFGFMKRYRPLVWDYQNDQYVNERTISTQQSQWTFVSQSRGNLPDEIGGVFWFSVDDSATTVFFPLYTSITDIPRPYKKEMGASMKFSFDCAFWIFSMVAHLTYWKWDHIYPDVVSQQKKLESNFLRELQNTDSIALKLYQENPKKAVEYLTSVSIKNGEELFKTWKEFYGFLMTTYCDGVKRVDKGGKYPEVTDLGYPEKWYGRIVKEVGPMKKVKRYHNVNANVNDRNALRYKL
jgi:dipeptidase